MVEDDLWIPGYKTLEHLIMLADKLNEARRCHSLGHLAGAAHVKGLDHGTEAIGCHGDDVLSIRIHVGGLHDPLGVQRRREQAGGEWHGRAYGRVGLALLEEEGRDLAAGGGRRGVLPGPLQLCGDQHQPLVQGVPQQLQWLDQVTDGQKQSGREKGKMEPVRK